MSTLLIRCQAPMQAWGTQSRFTERDTQLEPTKSGVIGLLCAALGRPREASLGDFNRLRMGVRVDREGLVLRDFHTALDVRKADSPATDTVTSNRYYLSDAVFLVGLEGELQLLRRLDQALQHPHWVLYLGRKSCPPSAPIRLPDGLRADETLEKALQDYPSLVDTQVESPAADEKESGPAEQSTAGTIRLVLECPPGIKGQEVRQDVPLSFISENRRFGTRQVTEITIPRPATSIYAEVMQCS